MILLAAALVICASGPRIDCVVDGDTFWHRGEKVRIENIDTPETHRPKCEREKQLGEAAKRRLLVLMNEGPIALLRNGKDRNNRTLARVLVDGRDIGSVLVDEGHARVWTGRRESWC